ncbi:MAG: LysM peptidoglycan-binding domain-containing protein [Bernardetiaceae bacterium]
MRICWALFLWVSIATAQTSYHQHRVQSGEDLLTIARTYSVNVAQLMRANPGTLEHGLVRGEIIYVPKSNTTPSLNDGQAQIKGYRVKAGETLTYLCQKYRMDMAQIIALNQLSSDTLRVGQPLLVMTDVIHKDFFDVPDWMLRPAQPVSPLTHTSWHTVAAGETLYGIARTYGVQWQDIQKDNNLGDMSIHQGQVLKIILRVAEPSERVSAPLMAHQPLKDDPQDLMYESGVGMRIRQQRESDQRIALHRSAAVGSFIRVHNESNGRYCTVRVIGHFPDINDNQNLLIKISEAACRDLGIINEKFPIVISRPDPNKSKN